MKSEKDAGFCGNEQAKYIKPSTEKHEPVKIIQGSDECGSLYYVALYALYT